MSSAIFIRSYWKDRDWLDLCLRSIARHCTGFDEVVLALPESSRPWMKDMRLTEGVRLVYCPVYRDDYLGQQITKLHADRYVAAELIVHVDADCMFMRPTRPHDLAPAGRARIATRPIAELGRHYPWRRPTEAFLGFEVELDFMQQPPFVYPRWLYPALRRHCLARHGQPIERYVANCPARGFSEFNALGAYALRHHGGDVDFVPVDAAAPPACCEWHWSWGGLTPEIRRRVEAGLAGAGAP